MAHRALRVWGLDMRGGIASGARLGGVTLRRAVAGSLFVVGMGVMAFAFGTMEVAFDPLASFGWIGGAAGAAIGTYRNRRDEGKTHPAAWAGLMFAAVALLVLAMLTAGAALSPVLADEDLPSGLIFATGLAVFGLGGVLWEHDRRVRVHVALSFVAMALLLGGMVGVASLVGAEGAASVAGVLTAASMTTGVVLLIVVFVSAEHLRGVLKAERAVAARAGGPAALPDGPAALIDGPSGPA